MAVFLTACLNCVQRAIPLLFSKRPYNCFVRSGGCCLGLGMNLLLPLYRDGVHSSLSAVAGRMPSDRRAGK